MKVTVAEEAGGYRATISGGWWLAQGKTEKEAVQRVVKRMEAEQRKMDSNEYHDYIQHEGDFDIKMLECEECHHEFLAWQLEAGVCEDCAKVTSRWLN